MFEPGPNGQSQQINWEEPPVGDGEAGGQHHVVQQH
jgi:hypothetical protein